MNVHLHMLATVTEYNIYECSFTYGQGLLPDKGEVALHSYHISYGNTVRVSSEKVL